jgi:hypothetical protein
MRLIALFLIATLCSAQAPIPAAPGTAPSGTITVPQNTVIPLTLVNPIHSKSTKPGDAVRAMVAFPVTVGSQIAIPAGSYVEGTVSSLTPPKGRVQTPGVQIHFTRLVFANGYSAPLDATNTEAYLLIPALSESTGVQLADARDGAPYLGEGFGAGQTTPQPPPLPHVGPNPAVIGGAIGGGAALFVVLAIVMGHHHANLDYTMFESGWQFQMTLQQPLDLDAAKVAAAAAATPAH